MTEPLNDRLLGKLIEFFRADTPDGERLAALDKSIQVLAHAGMTWPVLWQAMKVAAEIQANPKASEPDWQDPDLAKHKPSPNWRRFCQQSPARAAWLVQNHKRSKFAASLIEGVCTWGRLTPRQAEVVDRCIKESRERQWA